MFLSPIRYDTTQYNTIQYNTIQYNTIQYNTIQYNTIHTMQRNATQCKAMQCNAMHSDAIKTNPILQYNAIQSLCSTTNNFSHTIKQLLHQYNKILAFCNIKRKNSQACFP